MDFAREIWMRIETIHAVTYFGEESVAAGRDAGLTGFWMGYFGFRAAPMGRVEAGVVEAAFFNFAAAFVSRWVPDVWDRASPESLVDVRARAAAASLLRLCPWIGDVAAKVNADLQRAAGTASWAGRPLFGANRRLNLPEDRVAALWQLCTSLREHRGDGHVAALTASGLDGIEAHVLIALDQGHDPVDLQRTRGWSAQDWAVAVERCRRRGFVDANGFLTHAGRELRASVESITDELATSPWSELTKGDREGLIQALSPAAAAISASGVIRYPNPIGLPALA